MSETDFMTDVPDFGVSHIRELEIPEFQEITAELRQVGVDAGVEVRENSVYVALEWLIPTAVMIFLADKYFGTMIEEEAKQHYPIVRNAVVRVIRAVFQKTGTAYLSIVAVPVTKVSTSRVHIVSIFSKSRDGQPLKFLVDDAFPVEEAVDEIFEIMRNHYRGELSQIDVQTRGLKIRRGQHLVFVRDPNGLWRLVYPTPLQIDSSAPASLRE